MPSSTSERPITIIGAITANFIIAVAKFVAAAFTGSSSMLSEGFHSIVDTGNQGLLLLGVHQSKKPPDELHPFGHGKELYFWGLVVALILFGLGGGLSIYEGITHLQHPRELESPTWNYVVLGIAFLSEGTSFGIAAREFLKRKKPDEGIWEGIRTSKDPSIFVVLFEDGAAMIGLLLAFLGVFFSHRFQTPAFDGAASILIGLVLSIVAVFLAYESRQLLLGESTDKDVIQSVRDIVAQDSDVMEVRNPYTMHFGPGEILLNLGVVFSSGLSSDELAGAIDRLEAAIQSKHPDIQYIFLEAELLKKPGMKG